MTTFLENSLSVGSIFSGTFWLISCTILMYEFVSVKMVAVETRKMQFFSYHGNACYVEKKLYEKLVSYRFKLPLK